MFEVGKRYTYTYGSWISSMDIIYEPATVYFTITSISDKKIEFVYDNGSKNHAYVGSKFYNGSKLAVLLPKDIYMVQSFYHCRVSVDSPVPPNGVTITDDGQDWVFAIQKKYRKAFKAWATGIFAGGMNRKRIVGKWPHYEIRQP